ncbi:Piso0_001890 [Millerozyma farinosa CBS 7064]|uniref:2-dehydropantolactone reductase n=1 Tax=Pichia sorbitophila (strain ATCC MYA-4447 / BCRC 22081 / CBS 7064 / NBRC 10061 / NRRL Y-12695) TaxID=559304 RepID=G8YB48_PICSO|nr:Piso0_001890 [Millerozyma farinosa CBS 7064]
MANISYRSTETITFTNGQSIPVVGLGTWRSTADEAYTAVKAALEVGYRHIDTAQAYGNEEVIGKAIRDSGIPRDQIFITTKLWCTDHTKPELALRTSLEKLGLDHVDLYLMHWPVALNPNGKPSQIPVLPNGERDILTDWNFTKTWRAMQPLVSLGLTKAIGVSNFSKKNLAVLLESETTTIQPEANQVELHPYLPQHDLLDYCKAQNIVVEAYSPLGSSNSPLLKDDVVVAIAEKHNVSPATILISWAVWRKTVVLPKSVTPSRIETNLEIVPLSDDEGEELNKLHLKRGTKRFISPDWSPVNVFNDPF